MPDPIRYVTQTYQDLNYFLTSCTSTWLVYEPYYEAGKDTTGTLVTTDYNTKLENTMSYGPYKLVSLQNDKQIVFEKNENWYGYTEENGRLVSTTPYLVDGENVPRYVTDKIVINVMDDNAAKQAFLKGEVRYASLAMKNPERAATLFARNEAEAKERYEYLSKLVTLYGND